MLENVGDRKTFLNIEKNGIHIGKIALIDLLSANTETIFAQTFYNGKQLRNLLRNYGKKSPTDL